MTELGGKAIKFISPSLRGASDRLVVYKGVHFVELKSPTGQLSAQQVYFRNLMAKHGIPIHVLHTKQQVEDFIAWLKTTEK